MEGSMIDQWVEKLIPMFNGKYSLEDLTNGLPGPYRDRVYEIAEVLHQNGYVKDVSHDRPHQLAKHILKKYASQIEFLDSFVDSGAYRFQKYRQAKVLAVGSGPFFVSLVSALLESGLPKLHLLIMNSVPTNRQRLKDLVANATKSDPEVAVEEVILHTDGESAWREIVQPFDSILYVSQKGNVEELRVLHKVCREEKKVFLPAICLNQVGLAGPLVHPDSDGCWESLWSRIHQSALSRDQPLYNSASTGCAMMANVIAFECFKYNTGVTESILKNQFFLLNFDTLEGKWHSFLPHPLVTGSLAAKCVQDFDLRLEQSSTRNETDSLFLTFSQITSMESGIFHIWEEGDLIQLPLAQCRVQAVDPLSEGPANLLPAIVCTDLTHDVARREAGLAGIEAYVSRMVNPLIKTLPSHEELGRNLKERQEIVGVGVGATFSEGVSRGLQKCLTEELRKRQIEKKNVVSRVQLTAIEDERSRFYLEALIKMQGVPTIGLGEEIFGFPVVWVGSNDQWFGSVGLTITNALQKALQQALMKVQNEIPCQSTQSLEVSSVLLDEKAQLNLEILASSDVTDSETLKSATQILKRNQKQLVVFELELEPFWKDKPAGVYGVLLREEASL